MNSPRHWNRPASVNGEPPQERPATTSNMPTGTKCSASHALRRSAELANLVERGCCSARESGEGKKYAVGPKLDAWVDAAKEP